jgi:hypothetical protein
VLSWAGRSARIGRLREPAFSRIVVSVGGTWVRVEHIDGICFLLPESSIYSFCVSLHNKLKCVLLTAAPSDCSSHDIAHGSVSPALPVAHGVTVTVTCVGGWVSRGDVTMVCSTGGVFEADTLPSCHQICKPSFHFNSQRVLSSALYIVHVIRDNYYHV